MEQRQAEATHAASATVVCGSTRARRETLRSSACKAFPEASDHDEMLVCRRQTPTSRVPISFATLVSLVQASQFFSRTNLRAIAKFTTEMSNYLNVIIDALNSRRYTVVAYR